MAIFKKASPESALEALRSRAAVLESRRVVAQTALDGAVLKRQQHLVEGDIDGDDRVIERLERDVLAAASRLSGLVDAISALNVQISEAERQLQVERDAAERAVAAARLTDQVVIFERALTPTLVTMRALADACEPLAIISFEIAQVREFVSKMASEIEIASGFIAPDLRAQIGMVERGERSAPRQQAEIIELVPAEPVVTPTDPGEPVETWFTTKPVRWRGKDGTLHYAERWSDVSLPQRLVNRASQRDCIAPLSDARRKDHRGLLSSFAAPPHAVVDLDSERPPQPLYETPISFEPLPHLRPEFTLMHREPDDQAPAQL
jgi:hypothetical protein